jgi:hypothetical protein
MNGEETSVHEAHSEISAASATAVDQVFADSNSMGAAGERFRGSNEGTLAKASNRPLETDLEWTTG